MNVALHAESVTCNLGDASAPHPVVAAQGLVLDLAPLGGFLTALRRVLPVRPTVNCYGAEDGDLYVDLFVPDAQWSNWLSEQMSAVTVELLKRTGVYVGLVCMVEPELAGEWPGVPGR